MSDLTFRTKIEEVKSDKPEPKKNGVHVGGDEVQIDGLYTDYEMQHTYPFIVDQYDLGKFWNTDSAYTQEVKAVEDFLQSKVRKKTVNNSVDSIRGYLKEVENTVGIKPYTPVATKLTMLIQYIKDMKD